MTKLYPLELRGTGSLDVESLSSYIYRLAYTHAVSVNYLLNEITTEYYRNRPKEKALVFRANGSLATAVRPNETTMILLKILKHSTGQDNLRSGTFLAVSDALDRSCSTYSSYLRWCPACMAEFEYDNDPGYYKLIWQLNAVTHCNIHRIKLVGRCINCKHRQDTYGPKTKCTVCRICEKPLTDTPNLDEFSHSWKTYGSDLFGLIRLIGEKPNFTFPKNGIQKLLSYYYTQACNSDNFDRLDMLMPKKQFQKLMQHKKPVTLMTARRIAYYLGMDLVELLMGNSVNDTDILESLWFNQLPNELQPRKRKKNKDRELIYKNLLQIVSKQGEQDPKPLQQISKMLGVSTGYLHYHFPNTSKKIISIYKTWKHEQHTQNRLQARAAALEFFTGKNNEGINRSRKKAFQIIRSETGLPKNLLREEINEVYKVLS